MKKFMAMLLAICMCFGLCACTSDSDDDDGGKNSSKQSKKKITFTELVVVDNEYCKITINGIDPDDMGEFVLKTELENKTENMDLTFMAGECYVNDVKAAAYGVEYVSAGKKANSSARISKEALEDLGIELFSDIELNFLAYDSDDWFADYVADETVHIYPYGEEEAVSFVYEPRKSDQVLVDNEYVTVIVTGYDEEDYWGYSVTLFLINKTDSTVMFSADDVSINDYMCDPFYADSISAGKCGVSTMSWSETDLEESGISKVETIEFMLSAYNYDTWDYIGNYVDEQVTLNP